MQLRLEEGVPVTDLVSPRFPHLVPVPDLLLAAVAKAHGEPADGLLALDALLVEHAEQQRHLWQLELGNLAK